MSVCKFSACAISHDMDNPKKAGGGSVDSHGGVVGLGCQMDPLLVWQKVLSTRMFLGTPTEADVGSVDDWPLCFM